MRDSIYDQDTYSRFAENLSPLLSLPNVNPLNMRKLKKLALPTGTRTRFGSYGWRSSVSSRIGAAHDLPGKPVSPINPTN